MLNNIRLVFSLIVVLFIWENQINSQKVFQKRGEFSLGYNVIKAKFSPDNSALFVIRQNQNSISIYDPFSFQLMGIENLEYQAIPIDIQFFGSDILVAAQPNLLLVYQRKANQSKLVLRQKLKLKFASVPTGIRLQKLKEDFEDKSTLTSPRHLAVLHNKSIQVYKYFAGQNGDNIVTIAFNKTYQSTVQSIVDVQFYEQKYMIFGLKSGTAGSTNYLLLSQPTKAAKQLDSKQVFSILSFVAETPSKAFFAVSHETQISEYHTSLTGGIAKSGKSIANLTQSSIFYDNHRLIGFYNPQTIFIYRGQDSTIINISQFPTYALKLQQHLKQGNPLISVISMPKNNTGQLIVNSCKGENQSICFFYYSLCPLGSYYVGGPGKNNQACKNCVISNCEKCLTNGNCVKCKQGYYYSTQNSKCSLCTQINKGCTSCSQNGTICYSCDTTKKFMPNPISDVCICQIGYIYEQASQNCVPCSNKVPYCLVCAMVQENDIYCFQCTEGNNRVLTQDKRQCLCQTYYFQSIQTKQCLQCDPYQKCIKCNNQTQCLQCDSQKNWILGKDKTCICKDYYFQAKNKCEKCNVQGCITCEKQGKCKVCEDGWKIGQDGDNCVCNDDRFLNTSTLTCDICSSYIRDCARCSNNSQCSLCDQTSHRNQTPNSQGQCQCQAQYTQNQQKNCIYCSTPGCTNCSTQNVCQKCNTEQGFDQTIIDGKCQCLKTKYLDIAKNTCDDCSIVITGCKNCGDNTKCDLCNITANFEQTPNNNGTCKCINNHFVTGKQCLPCQIICENCQKCAQIVSQQNSLLKTSIGCVKCDDDFEVKDSKCVQKSGNAIYYIVAAIIVLTILIIVMVVYIKKRRIRKRKERNQSSALSDRNSVSLILKDATQDVIISQKPSLQKKGYEPLFSGNINYSISSEQRDVDKKSFNDSLKQFDKQKQKQYERKSKGKTQSSLTDLMKNSSINKKPQMSEQEHELKRKQNLFSHRGKG